jgi:AraC-like DNA-binding protein
MYYTIFNLLIMTTPIQLHLGEKIYSLLAKQRFALLLATSTAGRATSSSRPVFFEEDQQWLELVEESVQQNLANNKYTVKQLAYDLAISERQMRRRVKQLLGVGPSQFVRQVRLHHAQQLIFNRKYKTITQVAREVGYKDVDSFRNNFLSFFGVCPKEHLQS